MSAASESSRPSFEELWINLIHQVARRSTCCRMQTGSAIVDPKLQSVLSVGYNGVVSGETHCTDHFAHFNKHDSEFRHAHHEWSAKHEIHAESNAIFRAFQKSNVVGCWIYTIYSPCIRCAHLIYQAGLSRVIYCKEYDRETDGLNFLRAHGVELVKVSETPSSLSSLSDSSVVVLR